MASEFAPCPLCGDRIADTPGLYTVRVDKWQYVTCERCKARWDVAARKLFDSMRHKEAEHGKP